MCDQNIDKVTHIVDKFDKPKCEKELLRLSSSDDFESFYSSICEQIRADNTLDKIMEEFQLCADDQSRISYIFQYLGSNVPCVKESSTSKSEEEAQTSEDLYDILVVEERNAKKALEVIQTSVCKTPFSDLESLNRRYMKRGWASLLCASFEEAQMDAKRSLSKADSLSSMWNAYEVLGHCHANSKEYKESEECFMKALDGLKKSILSNEAKASAAVRISTALKMVKIESKPKNKAKETAKKQQKSKKNINRENVDDSFRTNLEFKYKNRVPKLFCGEHTKLPNASSVLKVVCREGRGRCVVANRDIPTGSVVMIDHPYAAVVNKDELQLRCNHCMQRTSSGIPCANCSWVQYCSSECERKGSELHGIECLVMNYIYHPVMGKMAPLVFRILVKATWNSLKQVKEKLTTEQKKEESKESNSLTNLRTDLFSDKKWNWDGTYSHKSYLASFYLVTNSTHRSFGDMFKRALSAVYICQCLKFAGYFGTTHPSQEDLQFVSSLALRHLQNTSCNAYEISESLIKASSSCTPGGKSSEVGGAVYPTISLTNHSCFPNVARYNVGNSCVLRTTRFIPKGCEILDNYGYYFHSLPLLDRREALQMQYKFECKCGACDQDWPVYPHQLREPIVFKCPNCKYHISYMEETRTNCDKCGESITHLIQDISDGMENYSTSLSLLQHHKHEEALALLIKLQELFEPIAVYPAKVFTDIQELIRHCYNCLGNVVTK